MSDALHSRRGEDPPRNKGRGFSVITTCDQYVGTAHLGGDVEDAGNDDCESASFHSHATMYEINVLWWEAKL